jgi:preprotein translocase subunit SecE
MAGKEFGGGPNGVTMATETREGSTGWLERSKGFVRDVQSEFKKITWPPQPEMVSGTIAVLVIVAVMATFLGIVDLGLSRVMKMVLG